MGNNLSNKKELLIFEYKKKFPYLCDVEIAEVFETNIRRVEVLLKKDEIIIPSKMNNKKNSLS